MTGFVQSQYLEDFSDEAGKKRYQDKVAQLQATADPFCLLQRGGKGKIGNYSAELDWLDWPSVTYADIYNHLIQTPSEYTHERCTLIRFVHTSRAMPWLLIYWYIFYCKVDT